MGSESIRLQRRDMVKVLVEKETFGRSGLLNEHQQP